MYIYPKCIFYRTYRNVSEISLKNSSEIQTPSDQTDTSFEAILNACEQNYDISKQDKKIPISIQNRDCVLFNTKC